MEASDVVTIIPSLPVHAMKLAPTMRAEDAEELRASHGIAPLQALLQGLEASTVCRTVMVGGEVAAIFGIAPLDALAGFGNVWGLSGYAIEAAPFAFLRASKRQLEEWLLLWPSLYCQVDTRYTKALRWARWLGFQVHPPIPVGSGALFHPAIIRRETWAS